jgi:hypothetical protein
MPDHNLTSAIRTEMSKFHRFLEKNSAIYILIATTLNLVAIATLALKVNKLPRRKQRGIKTW